MRGIVPLLEKWLGSYILLHGVKCLNDVFAGWIVFSRFTARG